MSTRYRITVTEDQLAGLQHALVVAERYYTEAIPQREADLASLEQFNSEHFLAMAKANLEYARNHLALIRTVSPVLNDAKPVQERKGRRS